MVLGPPGPPFRFNKRTFRFETPLEAPCGPRRRPPARLPRDPPTNPSETGYPANQAGAAAGQPQPAAYPPYAAEVSQPSHDARKPQRHANEQGGDGSGGERDDPHLRVFYRRRRRRASARRRPLLPAITSGRK